MQTLGAHARPSPVLLQRRCAATPSWVARANPIKVTDLRTSKAQEFNQSRVLVGSSSESDVKASGSKVAAQHIALEQRGEAVFCKALVGEDTFDSSLSWLNGTEMRPRVGYLIASGSTVTLGEPEGSSFKVEFKESSGKNAMLEMMMQGMVAGNADVAKALKL